MVQEAAYQSLLHKTRRQIHFRVATIFEAHYAGRIEEYAAILARHYELAGDVERAVEYLTVAGEKALRISAFAEANSAFERARRLLQDGNKARRAKLLDRQAEVQLAWSNYAESEMLLEEALTLAKESGDKRHEPAALLNKLADEGGTFADYGKQKAA